MSGLRWRIGWWGRGRLHDDDEEEVWGVEKERDLLLNGTADHSGIGTSTGISVGYCWDAARITSHDSIADRPYQSIISPFFLIFYLCVFVLSTSWYGDVTVSMTAMEVERLRDGEGLM